MKTYTKTVNDATISITDRKPLSQGAFGAFEYGSVLEYRVTFERCRGVLFPFLRFRNDDTGETFDMPLRFENCGGATETYLAVLDTADVCGGDGLFFYRLCFDSYDGYSETEQLRLTVYAVGFNTPDWFAGGAVYQIFSDRFNRSGEVKLKEGAVYNPDWYGGIPQHAHRQGESVPNNEFFGGNLRGITEKLPYLASLGICTLYLCPIFEAASNHKYDTGDYMKIDSMFGTEEDFAVLCEKAKTLGIRVILDGVFNHTGDDSRYFDKYSRYGGGAYSDPNSQYRSWYNFRSYPDDYECWWNIPILPRVNCDEPSYREFMFGEDGVIRRWIRRGASGWRLDVADELSDDFIAELRKAAQSEKEDALVLGEVWEDASVKVAYDRRRQYLRGRELDSVMNYPVREGIITYLKTGDCLLLAKTVENICENYPRCVRDRLLNFLGTHDTPRILNMLARNYPENATNDELAVLTLTEEERRNALSLLRIGYILIATLPGVPCIYYGDEAGMEGWSDPFNRRPYPWGREDEELLGFVRTLLNLRKNNSVLADGDFTQIFVCGGVYAYRRDKDGEILTVIVNMSEREVTLGGEYIGLLGGKTKSVPPKSGEIFGENVII